MEHREALTQAYIRIFFRYGFAILGTMGGMGVVLAEDPDVIFVLTSLAGLVGSAVVEIIYLKDWKKRGGSSPR